LRHGVRVVEEEDRNLLVQVLAHVDRSMDKVRRLVPVCLARANTEVIPLPAVAVFHREGVTAENHTDTVKRVAVPRSRLARREGQAAHQGRVASMQDLLEHCSALTVDDERAA
jgi:hypothetical protein